MLDEELEVLVQSPPGSADYNVVFAPIEHAARQRCFELVAEQQLTEDTCMTASLGDVWLTDAHALLLSLSLTCLSASCVERQTERDLYEPRIRCAGIFVDIELPGQAPFWLINSQTGTNYDLWCTCTTHEQWLGEDAAFTQWVNEMSYEACLAFVEREGYDPAYSTCEQDYEDGVWEHFDGVSAQGVHEEPEYCEVYTEPAGCAAQ